MRDRGGGGGTICQNLRDVIYECPLNDSILISIIFSCIAFPNIDVIFECPHTLQGYLFHSLNIVSHMLLTDIYFFLHFKLTRIIFKDV